jgi:hypothetical protein
MSVTSGLIRIVRQRRKRLARELQAGLLEVVAVEVRVAEGVHEVAGLVAADLGEHQGEQGVGGDVEGHAEEDVGAALVELAGEPAVGDVELEQAVAGRQGHALDVARVPGGDDVAARVRVVLQAVDQLRDLVDQAAVGRFPASATACRRPGRGRRSRRPTRPRCARRFLQVLDVGIALEEPQQFVDDRFQVQLLGGQQREAVARSKRICQPKTERVPVPVRSDFPARGASGPDIAAWRKGLERKRQFYICGRMSADLPFSG